MILFLSRPYDSGPSPDVYDPVFENNEWAAIIEACQNNAVPDTWLADGSCSKAMTIGGTSYTSEMPSAWSASSQTAYGLRMICFSCRHRRYLAVAETAANSMRFTRPGTPKSRDTGMIHPLPRLGGCGIIRDLNSRPWMMTGRLPHGAPRPTPARSMHFAFEGGYHVLTDWRKPVQRQTADCI